MLSENNTQFSPRYTPTTRRYTGPTARDLADRLPGSRQEGSGFRLRGWCHGHGNVGDSASLSVRDSDRPQGGITVKCWASCGRRQIIGALERETGYRIWDAWESTNPHLSRGDTLPTPLSNTTVPPPQTVAPKGGNGRPHQSVDLQTIARRTWSQDSQPIPADPDHPARRWLAARNLWRPELPTPGALRWLPAAAHYQGRGSHTGAGSIIALAAPPAAWTVAWPELPIPQSVQIIAVDAEGNPALDRPADSGGLGKRSIGSTTGAIVVLGCAELADALEPVRVAEGVADALAPGVTLPRHRNRHPGDIHDAGKHLARLAGHHRRGSCGPRRRRRRRRESRPRTPAQHTSGRRHCSGIPARLGKGRSGCCGRSRLRHTA